MVDLVDVKTEDTEVEQPNPMMGVLVFFVITSIYCALCIFTTDATQRMLYKAGFMILVITSQYLINLSLSESMCGVRQWNTTLLITFIPWLLIFGVLHLFLTIFPGWLSPFSNTIGYGIARLMGLPEYMKKILVAYTKDPNGANAAAIALENVRNDPSLLINELHTETAILTDDPKNPASTKKVIDRPEFNKSWDKLKDSKIIKQFTDSSEEDMAKNKLYFFISMKDTVAEYIWNILTGLLVTSVSYNYIIHIGCDKSPKEMKRRYDEYEQKAKEKKKDQEEKKDNDPAYTQQGLQNNSQ